MGITENHKKKSRKATSRMSKDVIFIDPPIHTDQELSYAILNDSLQGQEIPKGAHYIASYLKKNKIESVVIVTDPFLKLGKYKVKSRKNLYQKLKLLIEEKIQSFNPLVVALGLMYTFTEPSVLKMSRFLKKKYPNKTVIVGGNHASFTANYLLDPKNKTGIDIVVRGEGEWTMHELMQETKRGGVNLSKIKGISYRGAGEKVYHNPSRSRGDLNLLPPLDYTLIHKPNEADISNFNHTVMFARACKGYCAFCTSPEMWERKVTSTSTENFRKELEFLLNNKINVISILDDDILVTWGVFEKIVTVLISIQKKWPGIIFLAQSRVNHFINSQEPEETLSLMKQAGIKRLYLGIESGSQDILNNMRKGLRVEWIKEACRNVKRAGIEVGDFWLVGHPGATRKTENESLKFLEELLKEQLVDDLEIHNVVPYPGAAISKDPRISIFDYNKKHYGFLNNFPVYNLINPKTHDIVLSAKQIKRYQVKALQLRKKYLGIPINVPNKPLI